MSGIHCKRYCLRTEQAYSLGFTVDEVAALLYPRLGEDRVHWLGAWGAAQMWVRPCGPLGGDQGCGG